MRAIAKVRSKVFTEQFNIPIDQELKVRLARLRTEKHIDTHEEARQLLRKLVEELEEAATG